MKTKFTWGKFIEKYSIPIEDRYTITIIKYFPNLYKDGFHVKGAYSKIPLYHVEGANSSWCTMESAIIGAIEYIHCGANSHMTLPICKMLNIPFNSAFQKVPAPHVEERDNLRLLRIDSEKDDDHQNLRKILHSRKMCDFQLDGDTITGFVVDFMCSNSGTHLVVEKLDGEIVTGAHLIGEVVDYAE